MGLKEMIAELRQLSAGWVHGSGHVPVSAAAEALALVAWAEENRVDLRWYQQWGWRCKIWDADYNPISVGVAPTMIGAIRAAKEAYEAE
jgi:hypothetical protein